jgi:hypothetical protein
MALESAKPTATEHRADVGDFLPLVEGLDLTGQPVILGGVDRDPTLIVVVSPECASCDRVAGLVRVLDRKDRPALGLVVVSTSDDLRAAQDFARRNQLDGVSCVSMPSVLAQLRVTEVPCGLVVGRDGRILKRSALGMTTDVGGLERALLLGLD